MESNRGRKIHHFWLYPLVVANVLVVFSTLLYLERAYRAAEIEAHARVTNLATLVRSEIDALVGGIDMALRALSEEPVSGRDSEARRLKLIDRVAQDDREFRTLVIIDAQGQFVGGKLPSDGKAFNVVGRDYFNYLKDNPDNRMVVSGPHQGRSNGRWSLVFVRRLNHPDGSFAGLLLTGYAVERFADSFRKLNLDAFEALAVFTADRTPLVGLSVSSGVRTGQKDFPFEFADALGENPERGVIERMASSKGQERQLLAYERTTDQRFYVVASVRLAQVFATVHQLALALTMTVALILFLSAYFGLRTWRAEARMHDYQNHLEAMVESRTQALTIARDEAEGANRAKQVFLANMSHELRTPMNSIMGFTDIVKRHLSDPKDKAYLDSVSSSAHSLMGLIKNLIDLSRIASEQLVLEEHDFRMADVLQHVSDVVSQQAAAKGITFTMDIAPDFDGALLRGDAPRIGLMVLNLAENAVKFTTAGEVAVQARIAVETADQVEVVISVRDTGIGIAPEDQKRLFSAFEQVDGSSTRRYGGTGIGLALCKRLAERMGGTVRVFSEPGQGSEFTLLIKLAKVASPPGQDG